MSPHLSKNASCGSSLPATPSRFRQGEPSAQAAASHMQRRAQPFLRAPGPAALHSPPLAPHAAPLPPVMAMPLVPDASSAGLAADADVYVGSSVVGDSCRHMPCVAATTQGPPEPVDCRSPRSSNGTRATEESLPATGHGSTGDAGANARCGFDKPPPSMDVTASMPPAKFYREHAPARQPRAQARMGDTDWLTMFVRRKKKHEEPLVSTRPPTTFEGTTFNVPIWAREIVRRWD